VKGETVASASLEMKPDVLTVEMHRKSFLMSYPLTVKLSARKPANITREPKYTGSPRYGTVKAGNGPRSVFDVVFDESESGAKLYLDADHDGDLTNDPPVAWDVVKTEKDKTSLETLLRLPASWSEDWKVSEQKKVSGTNGINRTETVFAEGFIENFWNLFSQITKYEQMTAKLPWPFSLGPDRSARGIPSAGPSRDSFSHRLTP
jgi:hypothetical protein